MKIYLVLALDLNCLSHAGEPVSGESTLPPEIWDTVSLDEYIIFRLIKLFHAYIFIYIYIYKYIYKYILHTYYLFGDGDKNNFFLIFQIQNILFGISFFDVRANITQQRKRNFRLWRRHFLSIWIHPANSSWYFIFPLFLP